MLLIRILEAWLLCPVMLPFFFWYFLLAVVGDLYTEEAFLEQGRPVYFEVRRLGDNLELLVRGSVGFRCG